MGATYATPICRWAAGGPRSAAAAPATQPNRIREAPNPRQSTANRYRNRGEPSQGNGELTLQSAWYSFWRRLRQPLSAMAKTLAGHAATEPLGAQIHPTRAPRSTNPIRRRRGSQREPEAANRERGLRDRIPRGAIWGRELGIWSNRAAGEGERNRMGIGGRVPRW